MNHFGLTPSDYDILLNQVFKPLKNLPAEVYVFGSRARGDNQKYSDIDVLFELKENINTDLKNKLIAKIKEDAEESNLTIKLDLVNIDDLAESYRKNVLKDRINVFL